MFKADGPLMNSYTRQTSAMSNEQTNENTKQLS